MDCIIHGGDKHGPIPWSRTRTTWVREWRTIDPDLLFIVETNCENSINTLAEYLNLSIINWISLSKIQLIHWLNILGGDIKTTIFFLLTQHYLIILLYWQFYPSIIKIFFKFSLIYYSIIFFPLKLCFIKYVICLNLFLSLILLYNLFS
jgi:hypothetical protein